MCKCSYIGLFDGRSLGDGRTGQDRRGNVRVESEDRRTEKPRRATEPTPWPVYGNLSADT